MYDVAIAGARCAGSALALMLARQGLKIVAIDRASFPSDTMSGHFIQPAGVSCLRRLGLFETLEGLRAPAQETMTVDFGPVVLSGRPAPAPDGTSASHAPRRYLFDPMLADAAVAAGAELREGVSFVEPVVEGSRVVGMQVKGASGRTDVIQARLVVGADGKRSRMARAVGAQAYDTRPAASCMYYGYWSGFDADSTRLFIRDSLFAVTVPSNDDLTFVGFAWPHVEFARVRADVGKAFGEAAATLPWIADRLALAKQVGRFIGTGDLDGFFRPASGPGWALLGDAGYHKDPITAQGMTDALLHAELLATAIVGGWSEGGSLDGALADYGRRRDAKARPMYAMTSDLARLAPPSPEMAALISALQHRPADVRRFLGIMAGTVAIDEFFDPANLARITGQAAAAA
jgi:2-polyprenyl-6-methoxyphenol hydroxylase-like FAD-dependent oxidoreductase